MTAQRKEALALVLSLAITGSIVAGGLWWFLNRSSTTGSPAPTDPSPEQKAETIPPINPPRNPGDFGVLGEIQGVPSGLFNYGGSTTWAPIREVADPILQAHHPDFRLRYTDPVVGTPGSGRGIKMLLDNQLAFSQSSRALKDEEYETAQTRGYRLREVPVAIDGIAIVVNHDLDLPGLTVTQLRDIYTGAIANWSEVGGPDLAIVPYSRRQEDGGTVEFFVENVMGGQEFGANVQFVYSTTPGLREVSDNLGGIYYATAPEVVPQCSVRSLPLGRTPDQLIPPYQEPAVPPSECPEKRDRLNKTAFSSGDYPITRRLFVIIKENGSPDQEAGEAYAELLLSDAGQTLISEAGFVPIR